MKGNVGTKAVCAGIASITVLCAVLWLNFEPLALRWDDISSQQSEGSRLDPYPLGWPKWFYHDLSDGSSDFKALALDAALLFILSTGTAWFGWCFGETIASCRFSLRTLLLLVTIIASWSWLLSITYPSASTITLSNGAVLLVLASVACVWWTVFKKCGRCCDAWQSRKPR